MQILGNVDPGVSAPQTAPTSLSSTVTQTTAVISFTAPSNDGGSPITNYEYSFNNSTFTALSPADATTPVTISGLTGNTSYTIYLRAVNIVGSGPASTGLAVTTSPLAPQNAPTSLSASSITATSVVISFTAPTDNGGSAITNYQYNVNGGSFVALSPADATTPVSISGLTANTSTTITLKAVNAVGVGTASTGVTFTTLPTFISATGGTTTDYSIYRSHEFTSGGSFVVSSLGTYNTVDILVVAGGGGGGGDRGGAGGAGGFRTSTQTLGATGTFTVTIGGAGGGGVYGSVVCTSGGNSSISGTGLTTISSTGGGRGADLVGGYFAALSGGSGGGGNPGSGGGAGNAGGYSPVEGYRGGNSNDGWMGAGGGGASGVGADNSYGAGGAGAVNAYKTGSNITYANGGNGSPSTGNSGNRGAGGGGATAGVAGVVVVRYRIS